MQFGLPAHGDCTQRLRDRAVTQVREWIEMWGIQSEGTLLQIVAGMLSMKILFIREDSDLHRYAEELGAAWPELGAQLRIEFLRSDTMGLLLAHPSPAPGAHRNYAFVDARGDRSVRAYFTAWHEVAHLLLHPPQLAFSGFRRVSGDGKMRDPVEALVDQVAGELAFYEPFVKPALSSELARGGLLTLEGVDRIGGAVAPEASFSATAHALVRMVETPVAFLIADMRLKPTEERALVQSQLSLIEGPVPQERLRVVSTFPNETARAVGFQVFQHMRVPPGSVVMQAFERPELGTVTGDESQADWESGGRALAPLALRVEARRFSSVVYALVHCTSPRFTERPKQLL